MNKLTMVVMSTLLIGNALHAMQSDVVKDAVSFRIHGVLCKQYFPCPAEQVDNLIEGCACPFSRVTVEFMNKHNMSIKAEPIDGLFLKSHIAQFRTRLGSKPEVEYIIPFYKETIEFFDRFNNHVAIASSDTWSTAYKLVGGTVEEPMVAIGDEAIQKVKPYINNPDGLKNIRMFTSPEDRASFIAKQATLPNKIVQRNRLGLYIAGAAIVGISGYILYKKWRSSQNMKKKES